jgi:hypothetical protein
LSVHNTVRRYHDSLINFLRQRLRTPEDANDVAQEAYIRMMQVPGFPPDPLAVRRCCSESPSMLRTTSALRAGATRV